MKRSQLHKALSRLQHAVLAVLRRTRARPRSVLLFNPRTRLHLADGIPSFEYKEIFVSECYSVPVDLPINARILDFGAHLGLSVLYFLDRYPGSIVTAFEPNPLAYSLLKETLGTAVATGRVRLMPKAISDTNGRGILFVDRNERAPLGASLIRPPAGPEVGTVDVDTVDIRQFLAETVDHMKMDIEGHEYQLLILPEVRPERVRSISVELHDLHVRTADLRLVLDALVMTRGYRLFDRDDRRLDVEELCQLRGNVVVKFCADSSGHA